MTATRSRTENLASRHPRLLTAAAAAAATAAWVEYRARKAESDNPPIGRSIEADGVRLHYVDRGEGPTVVLLHGNAVLLQDFIASGLINLLATRYRVIAFDRPGFGYSERPRDRLWTPGAQAEVLQQALKKLDVEQPIVLGHSWGTLVALSMALDEPTAVRGLVLVSGYYYPTERADVPLFSPAAIPVVGDVMRYTVSPLVARAILPRATKLLFAPRPVPAGFLPTLSKEMMLRPIQLRAFSEDTAFMVPAAAELEQRYAQLSLPVRLIGGSGDQIVNVLAHSARLHRELPNSQLTIVPGSGHMVHYAARDRILAAVDELAGRSASTDGSDSAASQSTADAVSA